MVISNFCLYFSLKKKVWNLRLFMIERFEEMKKAGGYYTIVVEDVDQEKIVGVGTLFVEMKFLRNCGKVFIAIF